MKCYSCGHDPGMQPWELEAEAIKKVLPDMLRRVCESAGVPLQDLSASLGSHYVEDGKLRVSYWVELSSRARDRLGVRVVVQGEDFDRTALAACVFLKAWVGRVSHEGMGPVTIKSDPNPTTSIRPGGAS